MNTEMKQFEVVNDNELVDIFGGYSNADCLKDYGKGILAGAVGGFLWGLPAGGVGAIPGAFVGAHVGAIGGGLACTGGKLGGR
ncbi:Blp family class II bacteriocin [Streptococcus hyointestinalis]|uniref:Blp family class II bacteriocin n=1 Tax=Streptococcus hyointestinalis TaxID=1337 RepID=UPI0023F4BCB3|nr:Blp family class II bacteriocin [Streptococcus hyointestinalis]MCI6871766.1 Blp family class II bacteriocin [Streptococcus hyointestinalis]